MANQKKSYYNVTKTSYLDSQNTQIDQQTKLESQRALIDQQTRSKRNTPLIMQPNVNSSQHNSSHRKSLSENVRLSMKENDILKAVASDFGTEFSISVSGLEIGAGDPVEPNENLQTKSRKGRRYDVTNSVSADYDNSLYQKHHESIHMESLLLPATSTQNALPISTLHNSYTNEAFEEKIHPEENQDFYDGIIHTEISSLAIDDTYHSPIEEVVPTQDVEEHQQKLETTPKKKKRNKKNDKKQKRSKAEEPEQTPDLLENSENIPQASSAMAQAVALDISNVEDFLLRPAPHGVLIKCRMTRDKSGMYQNMYPAYFLHLEHDNGKKIFLLGCRKRKKSATSKYAISTDPSDLSKNGKFYCGKLKSNLLGTQFTLYNCKDSQQKSTLIGKGQELASIIYESNLLGLKGPRKMTVIASQIENDQQSVSKNAHGAHDGLIEKWKKRDTQDLIMLHNKTPVWNEDTQSYSLNFNGRASQASVKNFQLISNNDVDYIVMQLGKVSDNVFSMDYSYPLCALQAFGVALSSFDGKLACE